MTEDLEQEEVQAILDAVQPEGEAAPAAEVQTRNFRQPRRLSQERLRHLSRLVEARLPSISGGIADLLRGSHGLTLASIGEVNVADLFEGWEPPFLVRCFRCRERDSWVVWDSTAGVAAVEAILSGSEEDGEDEEPAMAQPRRLSRSEGRIIGDLLQSMVSSVADALDLAIEPGVVAQDPEDLAAFEDPDPGADTRRLLVHLQFDGPGGASDLRIYLPDAGDGRAGETASGPQAIQLPEHLDEVTVSVAAYLGAVDVPLTDLLKIEVGDVIPLGIEVGTPVEVYVEDRACARALLGRHRDNLAVRIVELDARAGEIY